MSRQVHDADGYGEWNPATQAAWTIGMLRAAIADIPDDTLLVINAPDFTDPDFVVEQVVVGTGPTERNAPEQGQVFGLNCEVPEGPMELRAGRARALTARELLADREQSGLHREPSPRPDRELEAEP